MPTSQRVLKNVILHFLSKQRVNRKIYMTMTAFSLQESIRHHHLIYELADIKYWHQKLLKFVLCSCRGVSFARDGWGILQLLL